VAQVAAGLSRFVVTVPSYHYCMRVARLNDNDLDIPSSFPQAKETRGREEVTQRHSHAPHQQIASGGLTFISRRGAGLPRFPSDKIRLGYGTVTKEEYDRQWEKIPTAS
jgi:hypothetical protein